MWTRQYKKRNFGRMIVPAMSLAVLVYFGFHAWHGDYGIYSKVRLESEIERQNERLASLIAERMQAERRIQLLHDGTLDKDMLDEQIRRLLNYSASEEVMILRSPRTVSIN